MIFEIINPSDMVTFESEYPAALHYGFIQLFPSISIGLVSIEEPHILDRLPFANIDEWKKIYTKEVNKLLEIYGENGFSLKIVDSMETILYGDLNDRKTFKEMIKGDNKDVIRFKRETWNNNKRSSLTDYSKPTLEYVDYLRNTFNKESEE